MKYNKISVVLCFVLLFLGCYHYIPESGNRDLSKEYTIQENPTTEAFKKIDTTAYYVQFFVGRYYNESEKEDPMVYVFHNDGYFKSTSVNNFEYSKKFEKNGIHYGGKYKLTGDKLTLEKFYPSQGGKTSYYKRNTSKAIVSDDIITIYHDNNRIYLILKKRKELPTPNLLIRR